MPTNLTDESIADTYSQLLHVDGGPTAALKVTYSGTGVATALKLSTAEVGVGNLNFNTNTISTTNTNGNMILAPNGTGEVQIGKVAITGGYLSGITDLAIADGGTGASDAAGARTNLGLAIGTDVQAYDADTAKYDDTTANFTGTLQNGGSDVVVDTDIGSTVQAYDAGLDSIAGLTTAADKMIYTTASDTYAVTDLTSAGRAILDDADASAQRTTLGLGSLAVQDDISYTEINDVAYGIFYDNGDQSFTADTATVVEFDTVGITEDISVVSSTQITFATAGTYRVTTRLQFANADSNDRVADIWFRLDGTDIPYSASEVSVPKTADGGRLSHSISGILTVTAGQYVEVVVAVEDVNVTLEHQAAISSPYVRPVVPSAILTTERIA